MIAVWIRVIIELRERFMTNKDDQIRQAHELFAALKLPGWRESSQTLRPGGQAGVLIVEDGSGTRGVFRCLTQNKPKSIERFYRELRILTDPQFAHPNVVEILDFTRGDKHQWYISRLGHPFKG